MLVLASKKIQKQPWRADIVPKKLAISSQNIIKSFQSNGSLEGVKDEDTLVILVAASANLSSVLKRQLN